MKNISKVIPKIIDKVVLFGGQAVPCLLAETIPLFAVDITDNSLFNGTGSPTEARTSIAYAPVYNGANSFLWKEIPSGTLKKWGMRYSGGVFYDDDGSSNPLHPSTTINGVKTYSSYQDWAAGSYSAGDKVNHEGYYYVADTTTSEEPSQVASDWTSLGLYCRFFGHYQEGSLINRVQYNRDLTNASWTKTNCTVTFDQTGADGVANNASLLNFTANNGTCIYTSLAYGVNTHAMQMIVERDTGTGTIEATIDGGTTWQDITAELNDNNIPFAIDQSVAFPQFGFRGATSGDKIIVKHVGGYVNNTKEDVLFASIINTSGSDVTRADESCSWPISGNFNNDEGMLIFDWSPINGLSATRAQVSLRDNINSLAYHTGNQKSTDGTTTIQKVLTGGTGTMYRVFIRWNSITSKFRIGFLNRSSGDTTIQWNTEDTYDGSYILGSTINLFYSIDAPAILRNLHIYDVDRGESWLENNYA